MSNHTNYSVMTSKNTEEAVTFFRLLLEAEQHNAIAYPWNPAEASDYFTALEADLDWLPTEAASEAFFSQLDRCWSAVAPTPTPTPTQRLLTNLMHQFTTLPKAGLEAMAQRASQVLEDQMTALEQLVQCAQELLPSLDPEDLALMARPYAVALRSKQEQPTTLPKATDWQAMPELERGKLAMAIAHWMLTELKASQNKQ